MISIIHYKTLTLHVNEISLQQMMKENHKERGQIESQQILNVFLEFQRSLQAESSPAIQQVQKRFIEAQRRIISVVEFRKQLETKFLLDKEKSSHIDRLIPLYEKIAGYEKAISSLSAENHRLQSETLDLQAEIIALKSRPPQKSTKDSKMISQLHDLTTHLKINICTFLESMSSENPDHEFKALNETEANPQHNYYLRTKEILLQSKLQSLKFKEQLIDETDTDNVQLKAIMERMTSKLESINNFDKGRKNGHGKTEKQKEKEQLLDQEVKLLKQNLKSSHNVNKCFEEKMVKFEENIDQLNQEIIRKTSSMQNMRNELNHKIQELNNQINKKQQQQTISYKDLNQKITSLELQNQRLTKQLIQWSNKNDSLENKIKKGKKEKEKLQKQNEQKKKIKEQLQNLIEQKKQYMTIRKQINDEKDQVQKEMNSLHNQFIKLEKDNKLLREELAKEKENSELKITLKQQEQKILQQKIIKIEKQNVNIQQKLQQISKELNIVRTEKEQLSGKTSKLLDQTQELQKSNQREIEERKNIQSLLTQQTRIYEEQEKKKMEIKKRIKITHAADVHIQGTGIQLEEIRDAVEKELSGQWQRHEMEIGKVLRNIETLIIECQEESNTDDEKEKMSEQSQKEEKQVLKDSEKEEIDCQNGKDFARDGKEVQNDDSKQHDSSQSDEMVNNHKNTIIQDQIESEKEVPQGEIKQEQSYEIDLPQDNEIIQKKPQQALEEKIVAEESLYPEKAEIRKESQGFEEILKIQNETKQKKEEIVLLAEKEESSVEQINKDVVFEDDEKEEQKQASSQIIQISIPQSSIETEGKDELSNMIKSDQKEISSQPLQSASIYSPFRKKSSYDQNQIIGQVEVAVEGVEIDKEESLEQKTDNLI